MNRSNEISCQVENLIYSSSKNGQALTASAPPVLVTILPETLVHYRFYRIADALPLAAQIRENLQTRWGNLAEVSVQEVWSGCSGDNFMEKGAIRGHFYACREKLPVGLTEHPLAREFFRHPTLIDPLLQEDREVRKAAKQLKLPYKPAIGLYHVISSFLGVADAFGPEDSMVVRRALEDQLK